MTQFRLKVVSGLLFIVRCMSASRTTRKSLNPFGISRSVPVVLVSLVIAVAVFFVVEATEVVSVH